MACDEGLVERIRNALAGVYGVGEKRMFGGVCFTLNGNMVCGVVKDRLMLRLGAVAATEALRHRHAKPMDFTGRPMKGYLYVESEGLAEDAELQGWIDAARAFVAAMPIKPPKARPPAGPRRARVRP